MLFFCFWHNVEISGHKHFVVVSRHQQAPPLTTSDKCNLPRSGGTVLITWGGRSVDSTRWSRDIGSESRFLPTPPAFDAPVTGFPSEYRHPVWYGKTRMVWLPDREKRLKLCLVVSTEHTNVTYRQTDGQMDIAWQHRPRLHSIARQNRYFRPYLASSRVVNAATVWCYKQSGAGPWQVSDTHRL